jgi:hypothetical protein
MFHLSSESKTNTKASLGIIPVKGSLVADDEAGTAFQAGLIGKINGASLLIPLITAGRA